MPWRWRPLAPWPIVPAKKTPGRLALSHHGVWTRQLARPNVATPRSGRSRSGADEPGRRDDVVDLDGEVAAAVGPPQADVEAPSPLALDAGRSPASRIGDAAAQDVVLVRLDVAGPDPDERASCRPTAWRATARRGRAGGPTAAGRWRARSPEFCLPMMKTRRPAYVSAGADVGVVVGVLHPRPGRRVRLGDADRDDQRCGAVRPVGGLDDRTGPSVGPLEQARPGPAAVVADLDRRPAPRTSPRFASISGRDGKYERAVHEARLDGAGLGLLAEQAVPVVALVRARAARRRGVRLGPRQQALEERPAPEHPAGRRIRGDHRVGDAQPRAASTRPGARRARCR